MELRDQVLWTGGLAVRGFGLGAAGGVVSTGRQASSSAEKP